MTAPVDWSFFHFDDPLVGMEKACSYSPSTDPLPEFENIGMLPESTEMFTSMPYCQLDSSFDTSLFSTNEACKPFANAWDAESTLTPPISPPYSFLSMPTDSPVNTFDLNDVLARDTSPTPSLCADGDYLNARSPASIKRSYSSLSSSASNSDNDEDSQEELPAAKRPKRQRGRPRLDRTPTSPSTSSKAQPRVPHNQVERKYREGLNAQLERLRQAVPTLSQVDDEVRGKPSKATILASAIAYIKKIERERDEIAEQVKIRRRACIGVKDAGTW